MMFSTLLPRRLVRLSSQVGNECCSCRPCLLEIEPGACFHGMQFSEDMCSRQGLESRWSVRHPLADLTAILPAAAIHAFVMPTTACGVSSAVRVDARLNRPERCFDLPFTAAMAGDHLVRVIVCTDEMRGSPFTVHVRCAANAESTEVTGGIGEVVAGEPAGFRVLVRDDSGGSIGRGGALVQVCLLLFPRRSMRSRGALASRLHIRIC